MKKLMFVMLALVAISLRAANEEYDEAIRLIRAGNFRVAETLLGAVLKNEDSPRVRFALGHCAEKQNRMAEASNHYRIAVAHNVNTSADPDMAERSMRRLFELQPHLAPVLKAANDLELESGKVATNRKRFLIDASKMLYNYALNPVNFLGEIEAERKALESVRDERASRGLVNLPKRKIPNDAVEFKGHFYKVFVFDKSISWYDAKKRCEDMGGHLVTIGSSEELVFVRTLADKSAYLWFGGYKVDGVWTWIDGTKWTVTGWADGTSPGRPDVRYFGSRSIDGGTRLSGGGWTPTEIPSHGSFLGFICEWSK